jgi:hypothetical protein
MSRRSLELPRRSHRIEAERTLSRPGRPAERALNAEATALRLVTGALFPVLGYDSVLALVFAMPGLPARPDTPVPTGPAYSRARSGEAPFSGAGADLLWRVKNGAKSVPFKTLKLLKDGSDLVLLRESNGMRSRRRKTAGRPGPAVPTGHRRWLVCFTVLIRTCGGRAKATQVRLPLAHNMIAGLAACAAATADLTPGEIISPSSRHISRKQT